MLTCNQTTVTKGKHKTHPLTHGVASAVKVKEAKLYLNAAPANGAIYFPHGISSPVFVSQLFIVSASVTAHIPI